MVVLPLFGRELGIKSCSNSRMRTRRLISLTSQVHLRKKNNSIYTVIATPFPSMCRDAIPHFHCPRIAIGTGRPRTRMGFRSVTWPAGETSLGNSSYNLVTDPFPGVLANLAANRAAHVFQHTLMCRFPLQIFTRRHHLKLPTFLHP